jgi:replication factor C subunit 1
MSRCVDEDDGLVRDEKLINVRYNKSDHPIAFHKGDMFAASKKKIADLGPKADNEDVVEVC